MSDKNIAADFAAHIASVHADTEATFALARAEAEKKIRAAQQEIYEAKELMEGIRARAPESFDIIGRLNALGAERVVQVGKLDVYYGLQMFIIDDQNHGTLLNFGKHNGKWEFDQLCWCCVDGILISDPIKAGIALGLRSWTLGGRNGFERQLMNVIRKTIETGELQESERARVENPSVEYYRELAPALDIKIKPSPTLRLANLTPKEWKLDVGYLSEEFVREWEKRNKISWNR